MGCANYKMDKCCFLIPATPGLIAWGYIKLLLLSLSCFPIFVILLITSSYGAIDEMLITCAIVVVYLIAIGFDIALIIGSHKENTRTLKICYYYLMVEVVLLLLAVPWVLQIYLTMYLDWRVWPSMLVACLFVLVQGVYSILLVKSEINKMTDLYGVANTEAGYTNIKHDSDVAKYDICDSKYDFHTTE